MIAARTSAIIVLTLLAGFALARLPDPPIFSTVQHYPGICYLPPDSGLCDDGKAPPADNTVELINSGNVAVSSGASNLQTYYYFDVATDQCYQFSTQNCGGNENRFTTLADCQARCRLRS